MAKEEMRDVKLFLKHILESIELIESYVKGVSEKEFYDSQETQDAVTRRLEIIGEAVKNLPDNFKKKHRGIPWKRIAGLRDVLIHEYFGVDLKLLWELLGSELGLLKSEIERLLKQ